MIFEVFEDVLAELDSQGRVAFGEDWEQHVGDRLHALAAYYGNQNLRRPDRALIDYSGLATQAAYLFMYAIGRAEFTYQILRRFRQALGAPLFPPSTLNITSIGGGPASELVGLIKYLDDPQNGEEVDEILYDVIDKQGEWSNVCELVVESLPTEILVIPQFYQCDITDAAAVSERSLRFDELVIMSFFVSEICALPEAKAVRDNIESLLSTMKEGSQLFYNDSDAYSFYSYMNNRARAVKGLMEIKEIQDVVVFDYVNPGVTYEHYAELYDKVPHLNSRALAKFYRRNV
jgi:hypothetical protein